VGDEGHAEPSTYTVARCGRGWNPAQHGYSTGLITGNGDPPYDMPNMQLLGGPMRFIITIAAMCFLMFVAYRGFSVIMFAPVVGR
jgi:hypothetical protein